MESQCSVSHSSINDIKTLDSVPVAIGPIPNEESAQCVGLQSSSSTTPIKTVLSKKRRKMLIDSDEDNTTNNSQDNQHPPKRKRPQILESDEEDQSPSNVALSKILNVDDTNEFTCNSDELLPDITKPRVSELQVPAKIVDTWRPVSSSAIEFIKSVMESNIEKSVSFARGSDKKKIKAVLREAMKQVEESISTTLAPVNNRLKSYTCLNQAKAENMDDNTRMAEREENTK